jgi:hypothetical protein
MPDKAKPKSASGKQMTVRTNKGTATIFFKSTVTPKDKKYSVITPAGRTIHFGARTMEQYKDRALGLYSARNHNDSERRRLYYIRHKNDNSNDPEYPSYYSNRYLW